jgi:DNA-binding CsgD family transcriptional regulator
MPDRLLDAASHFLATLEGCKTPEAMLDAVHEIVSPHGIYVLGSWRVPLATRRGGREPYPVYKHPSMSDEYWDGFWQEYRTRGPSFLARHSWNRRRDFTMFEAIADYKPIPEELWIVNHVRANGIADVLYIWPFNWHFFVYWSDEKIDVSPAVRSALRELATAASKRIDSLIGPEPDDGVVLTPRQREVWRALMSNGTPHLASVESVAEQLNTSESSVRTHIQRVEDKLGVHTIEDAAIELVRRFVVLALPASLACWFLCEMMICD